MSNTSRLNATIFFVLVILIAYISKPACWFLPSGDLKEFGFSSTSDGKKTLFCFNVCMLAVAVSSYFLFTILEKHGLI